MDSRRKSGRLEGEMVAPLEIPAKVLKKFQKEAPSVTEWQTAQPRKTASARSVTWKAMIGEE